jgi:hypothetical protein
MQIELSHLNPEMIVTSAASSIFRLPDGKGVQYRESLKQLSKFEELRSSVVNRGITTLDRE